jgi:hypothetical protein
LLCWFSRESPVSIDETYPYDAYHNHDITLVALGSALACSVFYGEEELFSLLRRVHPCRWGWIAWTLLEKIGLYTLILSKPFDFVNIQLLFRAFLAKEADLVN